MVHIVQNRDNTCPAAGHVLGTPICGDGGCKAILEVETKSVGISRPQDAREGPREIRVSRGGKEERTLSFFSHSPLGGSANAPTVLERCLSSASCNTSTTLGLKSALGRRVATSPMTRPRDLSCLFSLSRNAVQKPPESSGRGGSEACSDTSSSNRRWWLEQLHNVGWEQILRH